MPSRQSHLSALVSFIVLPLIFSQPVQAGWALDGGSSSLYYVTSKAAAVSELNSFGELSGSIADDGRASVSIMLGSVDTAIDIRNERMREIVFQVATYPLATVSLSADANQLNNMTAGDTVRYSSASITCRMNRWSTSCWTE